jgi:single-stranded DNA-binding protein
VHTALNPEARCAGTVDIESVHRISDEHERPQRKDPLMATSNNLNHCLFEGFLTHPPEYYPEKGKLLCFSIAVNADHVSEKVDNPMYLDVKVSGISEAQAHALIQGHEVRVIGQLQSKTWKRGDEKPHRYMHLYVADPMGLTLLAKPKRVAAEEHHDAPQAPEPVGA